MVKHNIYPQRVKYIPPWERDLHTEREKERESVGGGGEWKVGGDRENDKRERELDIYK